MTDNSAQQSGNGEPITLLHLTSPRLAFAYRQCGDLDGIPMILVHGSYATSRWWEPLMRQLPNEIRAIAPDLRGVGGTARTSTGYAIDQQANDLAAFIDALDLAEIELVAHSSGGAIAVEYTLAHHERVRTLTLIDPVPLEGVTTPLEGYVLLERMKSERDLLAQAFRALMPSLPVDNEHPYEVAFFEQLVTDAEAMDAAAFTALADALGQWNRFEDAGDLRLPTLLLWGEQDVIIERESLTRSLIAIPGANNLDVMRGVGHSPMIEAPVAVANRLVDFIIEEFAEFDEIRRIATEEDLSDTPDQEP